MLLVTRGDIKLEECPLSLSVGPHVVASGDLGGRHKKNEDLQPICLDDLLASAAGIPVKPDQPSICGETQEVPITGSPLSTNCALGSEARMIIMRYRWCP